MMMMTTTMITINSILSLKRQHIASSPLSYPDLLINGLFDCGNSSIIGCFRLFDVEIIIQNNERLTQCESSVLTPA